MKLYKAIYSERKNNNYEDKIFEFEAIDNDEARKLFNEEVECKEINQFSIKIFVVGEQISTQPISNIRTMTELDLLLDKLPPKNKIIK